MGWGYYTEWPYRNVISFCFINPHYMPFNGLLFGPELEGAACQLCQAECLRAAILLHRISTQPTVNNISTEGKIVYFRSIWQNYDTKSLANTSTGPNNKEQNTNKNCYFLPESLCSLLWRRDGWYRLERESFQSAICTPGEERRGKRTRADTA